jgi:hypothetical protein
MKNGLGTSSLLKLEGTTRTDPGFVGPEANTTLGALLIQKEYKITSTKLGKKVNIYIGSLPRPWKRPMRVRGLEAEASLASR